MRGEADEGVSCPRDTLFEDGADEGATPAPGALGRYTENVDARRARTFKNLRHAGYLLPRERVATCQKTVLPSIAAVEVRHCADCGGRMSFRGLQSCGSVWSCNVCSVRRSIERAPELARIPAWVARNPGHVLVLVTLTHSHRADDDVRENRQRISKARRALFQSRVYRRHCPVGAVTACEVTDGRNGPHVHLHSLMVISADSPAEALRKAEELRPEWMRSLAKAGLTGSPRRAFSAVVGERVTKYIGKWSLAAELSAPGAKAGKNGNRSMAELLDASANGDKVAGRRFVAIATAMKGAHQLHWGGRLRKLIAELEPTAEGEATAPAERLTVARIMVAVWRELMRRNVRAKDTRAEILEAAESAMAADGAAAVQSAVDEVIFRILAPPGGRPT